MKAGNAIVSSFGTSVFEVMSRLATEHQSINLGQGFPDDRGPADVVEAAGRYLVEGNNQYPPMMGLPELRRAVAEHGRRFYGLEVDGPSEVLVTCGATEALAACFFGLINPGDEVVVFEPAYDAYIPLILRAGGVPRTVPLTLPGWRFTRADLEKAFSPRTKLVVLNNPLNPAAKVFERPELELIAEFLVAFDAYAICDEAYEHLVFDGRRHLPLIALPGLRERCLKIGSAGKTFSITGWKIGYVTAVPALLQPVAKAHQFLTFTIAPNLQSAIAYGLGKDDAYFAELAGGLERKRDRLATGLRAAGLEVLPSEGTYFLIADIRSVGFEGDDVAFCRMITEKAGVTAIPVSAFYSAGTVDHCVRFCFAKQDPVLDAAIDRLKTYFQR